MAEAVKDLVKEGNGVETFDVRVVEAKLKRDEDGSGLPTLRWELRRLNEGGAPGEVVWLTQVFKPEELSEISRNLALCGIVCTFEELSSQLVKAGGCEVAVERRDGALKFVRRLDSNVFAGETERQKVAEEIPL